jgi:hypothetical protein
MNALEDKKEIVLEELIMWSKRCEVLNKLKNRYTSGVPQAVLGVQ